jgi:hypothetical protein
MSQMVQDAFILPNQQNLKLGFNKDYYKSSKQVI